MAINVFSISALTLMMQIGWQEGYPVSNKLATEISIMA